MITRRTALQTGVENRKRDTCITMKTWVLTIVPVFALLATLLSFTSGCAWSVGGTKTDSCTTPVRPTQGQQLIDLKKAHDQGAITGAEYEAAKQKVLRQ